jgi:DNA-binding IclR family transcriptional regulator
VAAALPVPSLERGLRVLLQFSAGEPVLSATELARRLDVPRTTAFRLLQTLEQHGFLERANGVHFRLGRAALVLGFQFLDSQPLTRVGMPILERLRDTLGLDTYLSIRDQTDIVLAATAQVRHDILGLAGMHPGVRLPAHATASGLVLLSELTRDELIALYRRASLKQTHRQRPPLVESLCRRVRVCHARGYATCSVTFGRGVFAIAAPVRNGAGEAVAALTVLDATMTCAEERLPLILEVRRAALDLSARLGYPLAGS